MKTKLSVLIFFSLSILPSLLQAQFTQQGSKLVGTGNIGASSQGFSVAVSGDGNTAIEGGFSDNSNAGAVWIFTRSGGVWSQQGPKLIGSGAIGNAYQGISVAISGDGNTAIIGGYEDNGNVGAAWIFIRNGGVWSQQGAKLVGTGAVGSSFQGTSVSISADGNTAIVGGSGDNGIGAVWVYTRTGGVWTQQGAKLFGTGSVGQPQQGWASVISADGNTIIVGGYDDNGGAGAAWIFTRNGGTWTQQGSKLVGSGAAGNSFQGYRVSISSDGNTAAVGGFGDNNSTGAVWVFSRNANVWTQQGPKLIGAGSNGAAGQGRSVAISPDGNSLVEGGWTDSSSLGAIWAFSRSGNVWTQLGVKLSGSGAAGVNTRQGISVSISNEGTVLEGGIGDNNVTGALWVFTDPTIGITPISNEIPKDFSLSQNYPNPFNPNSKIKFQIAKLSTARLVIYDELGREVSTLVNERLNPGTYEVNFDGSNLASGIYFYRLAAGDFIETKKMLMVK